MSKSSILFVGLDAYTDSIGNAVADALRDGEIWQIDSIGGNLASLHRALHKVLRKFAIRHSTRSRSWHVPANLAQTCVPAACTGIRQPRSESAAGPVH